MAESSTPSSGAAGLGKVGAVVGSAQSPLLVFVLCLAGWTLAQMDQAFFGFVIPQVMAEFKINLVTIGLILSIVFIVGGIGTIIGGALTDRYGRKPVFQVTMILYSVLTLLQGLAPNAAAFTAIRSLAVASGNIEAPLTTTIVVEESPARWRGVLAGILQIGYPIGWFIASLITVPVVTTWGWRAVFFVGIIPALFIFAVRFLFKETKRFEEVKAVREGRATEEEIRAVGDAETVKRVSIGALFAPEFRRTTILLFVATLLWAGAYGGTAFYLPTYLEQAKGLSFSQATYLVGIAYGISAIGYILASFAGEFVITRRNTMLIWMWIGALGFAGMVWLAQGWLSIFLWFVLMTTFFYGTASIVPLLVSETYPTHIRATGNAFTGSFAIALGLGLFPLLTGAMVSVLGWNMTFTYFVVIPLILAGVLLLFTRNYRSNQELEQVVL